MKRTKSGHSSGWYLSAAIALLAPSLGVAKSHVERIDVTWGDTPLLSIEGPTAREFTIWSGPLTTTPTTSHDFADWPAGAVPPPDSLPVFDIFFLCEACEPARRDTWRCYGVRYAMGAAGQGGFILIPASDDKRFSLNVQTIFHGVEGRWFRSSAKWEKLIRPAIEKARAAPSRPSALSPSPAQSPWRSSPIRAWSFPVAAITAVDGPGLRRPRP
jgi:hypothetical protein